MTAAGAAGYDPSERHSHGMQTGLGMEEGMGMIRQGHALSPELGPGLGRGIRVLPPELYEKVTALMRARDRARS